MTRRQQYPRQSDLFVPKTPLVPMTASDHKQAAGVLIQQFAQFLDRRIVDDNTWTWQIATVTTDCAMAASVGSPPGTTCSGA